MPPRADGHLSPPQPPAGPPATSPPTARPPAPLLLYGLAAAWLGIDQATKAAVVATLRPREPVTVIPHLLDLTYLTNTGGAFGVLPWATPVLVAVACLVIALLVLYGRRLVQAGPLVEVAAALILGGALGNLIDRVRLGYVVDFLDLHFWPVFNIADIGITVGALLMVLAMMRRSCPCAGCAEE